MTQSSGCEGWEHVRTGVARASGHRAHGGSWPLHRSFCPPTGGATLQSLGLGGVGTGLGIALQGEKGHTPQPSAESCLPCIIPATPGEAQVPGSRCPFPPAWGSWFWEQNPPVARGTLTSLTPCSQVRERDLPFVTHTLSSEFTILRVVNGETVAAENLGITNGFVKPKMGELRRLCAGENSRSYQVLPQSSHISEYL